ncbi:TAXI family TRAP transporter solute-binding subunit [Cohaesibacter celericrescens]|uniref:C4-dicarboxylate ABC transporter substrate-binding protein n=1 Tax=Cohaesibacter celericrescens TaxID=2067669 RepID=A0A2N5XUR3_9HYPH|nr:TAXI family TRAP transporter solute-binding subunit [Cohaesibacter celericrescens]PLW78251.1 C4-dicarboxylate ABC transporter substrate-binding protein [Cohaesibacter celericrescens]
MKKGLITLAATLALTVGCAHAADRVSIGTGGTGGVFYAVGAGMADMLTAFDNDISANAEVTGASIENVRRVSMGQMTIGFSSGSTLYAGYSGEDPFEEKQNVLAIAALYPAILQVAATAASKAQSMADLKDLRISVGPPGSNSSVLAERMLKAHDAYNPDKIQYLSYGEATNAIKNGNLDASIILAGVPASAFIELTTTTDSKLVPINKENGEKLIAEYPYYTMTHVPAAIYNGNDVDTIAIGDPVILFTSKDADEDVIYRITQTIFDNLDTLGKVHPAAGLITKEKAPKTPIPLHPGATRYYSE